MISIVIPNYNKIELLKNCIDSILNLNYKEIEIIVIDNGSSQCDWNIVPRDKIRLILLKENEGFSKAVNVGIKESKGDLITVLNNDTILDPDWADNIKEAFKDSKTLFATSKIMQFHNKKLIDDVGDIIMLSSMVAKIGYNEIDIKQYDFTREVFGASGAASVFRREFFDIVGYYDEDFFAYLEDVDLSFRANLYGYSCKYVHNAIVYHLGSATTGSTYNHFTLFQSGQNAVNVIVKNYPISILIRALPQILFYLSSSSAYYFIKGHGVSYFKGVISGLKMMKKMLLKRKEIMKQKVISNKELMGIFKENKKNYYLSKNNRAL